MPHLRLTDISISKLPFSKTRTTYWDEGGLPGFGVRVGARRKTFVLVLNRGYRIKLGQYPLISLKDARQEAVRRLSDPNGQKQPEVAPPARGVVEKFLETHHARSRPRWRKEQERLLTRHLLKKHSDTSFNRIATRDVIAILDELQHVPSEQLHTYRALKTLFTWARKRKVISVSPLEGLERPNKPTDRERVLSDEEIVKVYRTALKVGYPLGHIILIIFHTAIRPGKVGELKRSYVTADKITLPGDATKNKREQVLPNLIHAELDSIPKVGKSDYFFPNAVGGPLFAFGKLEKQFDGICGVTDWTLHDIRRTVRTKLAEWGCCDDAMAERILGHVTAESRISRIYNRWKFFPEMKKALEVYEERLAALLAKS
jgi:integrase